MESRRETGKVQYQVKGQLLKRCLTLMLAVMVTFTSMPLNMAWADELPYSEWPGDDEIILDDSVEEGDLSDIDLDISHTISKKGDKAVVTVLAAPSESGQENGVTKVTKVEIHQNGKLKKGKRSDDKWEFTVKENGVYSFVIYYNSKDGEDIIVASPSEIEKVEPTTEAEPQKPVENAGGAGGAGGGEVTQPGDNPEQEITTPETEEGTTNNPTEDNNIEDDKKNDETVEGDSNQNTSDESEQKPSDDSESNGTEEGKGDTTENQDETDSSEQIGNNDNSTSGGSTDTPVDNGNSNNSNASDSDSNTGSNDSNNSDSSDNSNSGSADNSGSDSSGGNDSGSSNSSSSDSSGSSEAGSSDSGSPDQGGSDEGNDSSETSIALNVIDFIFPVIEAQASDFTVKKAVIVEYEITNLFPEGNLEDVEVEIFDELTEEGAMITLMAEPSEIGLEKGVREITDISLIDFKPEEESQVSDGEGINIATDSEAEEEFIESQEEEEIGEASPSDATNNTSKSSSAKHAEYQASECEEGEYRFFVKENGTYTFSIRYGRAADVDFEDSAELVETQFSTTYELDSIKHGVQFIGIGDTTIQVGQEFDLMAGVSAMNDMGMELPVVVQDHGGFDPVIPGTYKITYTIATRSIMDGGSAERSIIVNPRDSTGLTISSNIHGSEDGKTLEVPTNSKVTGTLSVSYDLPIGISKRTIKISCPEFTSISSWPISNITRRYGESIDGVFYTCLEINDSAKGQITFDIVYSIQMPDKNGLSEAYLAAGGHYDLGGFRVIGAGIQSGELKDFTEEEIGPIVTRKNPADIIPRFVTSQVGFEVMYDSSLGEALNKTCSLTSQGTLSILRSPAVTSEHAPYVINKVRIYAPSKFEFCTNGAKDFYITGSDDEGNDYLEVSNVGSGVYSSLYEGITIVPKQGGELKPGKYIPPKYKIYYSSYNGEEKITEGFGPINSITVYNVRYEDMIGLKTPKTYEYNELDIGASYNRSWDNENYDLLISNKSTWIVGSNEQRLMPTWSGKIKVTMKYPEELQLQELRFLYDSGYAFDDMKKEIEKVVFYLSDGSEVNAEVNGDSIKAPLLDSKVHIDSTDIIFSSLYGYECKIQAGYQVDSIDKEKNVKTTMVVSYGDSETTVETNYLLKSYDIIDHMSWYISPLEFSFPSSPSEEEVQVEGTLIYPRAGKRMGGKLINPRIVIKSEDLNYQLDGTMDLQFKGLIGGKVNYTTSFGEKGEYDIDSLGKYTYVMLKEGETITELVISKKGTVIFPKENYYDSLISFGFKASYNEVVGKFGLENGKIYLNGKVMIESDNKRFDIEITIPAILWGSGSLNGVAYSSGRDGSNPNVYQGNDFDYLLYLKGSVGTNTAKGENIPINPDYYIELINLDKFAFMGVGGASKDYEIEVVERNEKRYLHIKANDLVKGNISSDQYYLQKPVVVKFKVLPGAQIGEACPTGGIYADLKEYSDRIETIMTEQRYKVILDNLVQDEWGITNSGDPSEKRIWVGDNSDKANLKPVNILPQSISSVIITPGKAQVYSADNMQQFLPNQRNHLNAMIDMCSGDSAIADYTCYIKLPRNGKAVTYSEGGNNYTIESEYNIYLAEAPELVNTDVDISVSYRIEGASNFLTAEAVGDRWHDVAEIKMHTDLMPGKRGVTLKTSLEADEKERIGLGALEAYMASEYSASGKDTSYGAKITFEYQDYQITGLSWVDNNEDGKYNNNEPLNNGSTISLLENGVIAAQDSYSYSISNGNYIITTYLYENLSLKFDGINEDVAGIKPTLTKADTNSSISVFNREGTWIAELPESLSGNQTGYNLGIVYLPILVANNTQVGYKSERMANVSVRNQLNAPAVNNQIIFGAAADTSIADVSYTGLIKGLKANSLTTATASVINSLGDKVTATYQVAVSDNKIPILKVHPWIAIEGDSIPDLWAGTTVEDMEEEYPAWKEFLFGVNSQVRSISVDKKLVTIYTDSGYTNAISLDDALKTRGRYYMRYSVEDDKDNIVMADTTLTVYGKMQGADTTKHYFQTGETITVPNAEFYYLDVSGAQVLVTESIHTAGENKWILNEGPLKTVVQTAVHPQAVLVSDGVIAGVGREATVNVSALVDSTIYTNPQLPEIIVIQYENVEPVRWGRFEGMYQHWKSESEKESLRAELTVGAVGDTTLKDEYETDTSIPGIYYTFRHAVVNEEYDNVDSDGQPLKNMLHQINRTIVVSKPVVEATEKIYVTPDQALDESFIKGEITTTVTYHDGTNPTAAIPDNQIKYVYNKTDGKITSVTITAWGGREDNISDPAQVTVVIREVPILMLPDTHLRRGTVYGPENFADRVLTPADEHNAYIYISNNLDTNTLGKYEAQYQVSDDLTGAEADQFQTIYVHGIPEITATDKSLNAHQSINEQALIDEVKKSATATVVYTKEDGTTETKIIPTNELQYEVSDYVAGTAGRFKVTITANDKDYAPAGLAPKQVTKDVYVNVADQLFDVTFTTNNDNLHDRGTIDGGAGPVVNSTIYGHTAVIAVPEANVGYHFDGFKILTAFTTTDDIQLADGSTITAGTQIPVGTILTPAQLENLKIYSDLEFQAYFSASPVINGENFVLYEKEAYSQDKLHIEVTDLDGNAQPPEIDDSHVDTNVAGTYQVKVTVEDTDGNQTVKYLYVQIVGKTEFINIPDLHIRKDTATTEEMLVADVKAVYAKPEEIPEEPWAEASKVNNGHAAITTAVEVHSYDVVNADTVQKTPIYLSSPGMIHGREMTGKAEAQRNIYIHGLPVIVAYDSGIYTHQSTSDAVLEQIVKTGTGTLERDAASAYVEYVQPDGSVKRVEISPDKITYTVNQFVPLTAGDYSVSAKVDDFSVIAQAQAPDLSFATGEKTVKIVVADKMYSVMFEMGEHGRLEDPSESITAVAHGKKVTSPKLAPEEGYTLDYWVDEVGNRISDLSSVVITENRKFTAEFKLKEFTVRFIGKKDRVIKTEIVKYGFDATPPTEDKDVKNKRFNGWSTSYTNITKDTDIYTTYWKKSGGGGPNGGGSFVPSGPGMETTITEPGVPKNPFENLVTIGTNPVPTGNTEIPVYTGLPKTGDVSEGIKAHIGYQATLIDGTRALSEEEPLVGHQNSGLVNVFEEHADWKKCILHIILLIVSALEGIFYLFKRRKDKRFLDELRKELEEEDK